MEENMKATVYVEYQGKQAEENEILSKIKEVWLEEGHLIKEIKTLNVYVKPEDNTCYYTINDEIQGSIDLY